MLVKLKDCCCRYFDNCKFCPLNGRINNCAIINSFKKFSNPVQIELINQEIENLTKLKQFLVDNKEVIFEIDIPDDWYIILKERIERLDKNE